MYVRELADGTVVYISDEDHAAELRFLRAKYRTRTGAKSLQPGAFRHSRPVDLGGSKTLRGSASCCAHCGNGEDSCQCTIDPRICPCCIQACEQFKHLRDFWRELGSRVDQARLEVSTADGLEHLSKALHTGPTGIDAAQRRVDAMKLAHHHEQAGAKAQAAWDSLRIPCRCGHRPGDLLRDD
jgi:hypothetical protein